jgi:hypothetical protein
MAVDIKIAAFYDVTPCNLVDVYKRFGEIGYHHLQDGR